MRLRTVWIMASILVLLGIAGCRKSEEDTGGGTTSMTEQAKKQAGQAMETTAEFAGQTKDQFVETTQQTLDGLQQKYQEWKQKTSVEGEQAQQKLGQLQTEVETHLKTASESLAQAKEAGTDAWSKTASTVQDALTKAQNAYDQFVSYVKTQDQTTPAVEE